MEIDRLDTCRRLITYATAIRKASGLTTNNVAEKIGVKQQQISRLEGGTVLPTLASFVSYADGIGCEVELVRKDSKNDYRMLSEMLLDAIDSNDKESTARIINDLRTKVYQDQLEELELNETACDLLLKMNDKSVPVTVETKKAKSPNKRLKSYSKKLKGDK